MSQASESDEVEKMRQQDEMGIFALRDQVRKENNANDAGESSGTIVIDSNVLTSTIVPAMNELLKEQKNRNNSNNIIEEKKDADMRRLSKDDESSRVEFTCAILECMVSFVAATCGPPADLQAADSPSQQTSYNSLSFRRSTPKKEKNRTPPKSRFSSTPKRDKELFVASGALEMAVCVLQQVLEEHVNKASADSWSRNKSADLDTFDSIGVADSSADIKIESTMPENEIPALVMHLIACLTHKASDAIKSDAVLPHLASIVHKSMMVFLPSPEIQAYGCWTLYSLSNPLLQELIAAGSVSVLVRAMKCHHTDARVQEHGNKALYNLLHLLVYCTDHADHSERSYDNETNSSHQNRSATPPPPSVLIEIDGEQLEDYSSLLPNLPAIVIRGMEFHSDHLGIQQYGLLVLTRLCQQDKEKYEVVISEGGLTALLHMVTMATKAKLELQVSDQNSSGYNDNEDIGSIAEKYDCLAQMACQFLRDISRPTNSSMDILRIIAVKGGMKTVLKLLNHYNEENMKCGGVGSSDYYGNSQKFAIINIIDPAMACLRNLMTNEDNRREVMTFLAISKTMEQEKQSDNDSNPYGDDDDDGILVCANLIPIVLKTMDAYPLDAPIQAYGCDLLGRLAQGEQAARIELIQTTIDSAASSASGRDSRNHSRLWKQSSSPEIQNSGSSEEDADIKNLSDQMKSSIISSPPKYRKKVDVLVTAIRAMKNHRNHHGAQERTVTLILAMVIDRDAMFNRNGGNTSGTSSASYYLIQRLQEVYELQIEKNDPPNFSAYLQGTVVPPKGIERLKTLTKIVEDYDRRKAGDDPSTSNKRGSISQRLFGGWNKPGQ